MKKKPVTIIRKNSATRIQKVGVQMHIYKSQNISLVYQKTKKGHAEEFYHTKSTFHYFIVEGKGSWFINGKEHKVKAGDLISIPPNNTIYYKGNLKQVLVTLPAYQAKYEHHVRNIKL